MALRPGDFAELCAGGGALGLAVRLAADYGALGEDTPGADDDALGVATGVGPRTVCYVENELTAVALLQARIADGALDDAPIWSNLRSFDARPWRGLLDGVVAGFPCPPYSVAGKRARADDPRDLWPDCARVVRSARPRWAFFENVGGSLRDYHERFGPDLARAGYRHTASLFTAAEVGAPHGRERLFVLAYAGGGLAAGGAEDDVVDAAGRRRRPGARHDAGAAGSGDAEPRVAEPDVADPGRSAGRRGVEPTGVDRPRPSDDDRGAGGALADTGGERPQGERGAGAASGPARRDGGAGLPLWPPGPGDGLAWRDLLDRWPDLAPALERAVRGAPDGLAPGLDLSRTDRLRITGNGVVVLVAAYALRALAADLGVTL